MLNRIRKTIRDRSLLQPGQHLLIGVSGGADSVSLAHALHTLQTELKLQLTLAHLNHRLRGEASDEDEAFVRNFGAELGLKVLTASSDVAKSAARKKCSLEMAAREARHRFFRKVIRDEKGDAVALAHSRDDQAETLLLKLLRGTGLDGLGGMEAKIKIDGLPIIRPLIDVSRTEIIHYLKQQKLSWREDASNLDARFIRNRIRHELLPMLEAHFNPNLREVLARTSDILRADAEWLKELTGSMLETCSTDGELSGEGLSQIPSAAQRRVIHKWLLQNGVASENLTYGLVLKLNKWLETKRGSKTIDLPAGRRLVCRYGSLRLESVEPEVEVLPRVGLNLPGETLLPEWGLKVSARKSRGFICPGSARIGSWPASASLHARTIGRARVYLRARQAGDRYAPLGMAGTKKIQDLLVDLKVPKSRRDRVPVIECRQEIVWVPGYQVARGWGVPDDRTASFHLEIEPFSPES